MTPFFHVFILFLFNLIHPGRVTRSKRPPGQTTRTGTRLLRFLVRPLHYIRPRGSKCFARGCCALRGLGSPSEEPACDRRTTRPNFSKLGVNLPYIVDSKQPKGKNSSWKLLDTLATNRPTPL